MNPNDLGRLMGQVRPRPGGAPTLVPCVVTRADSTGVWVTPIGGDTTSPLGPCVYRPLTVLKGSVEQGYTLDEAPLPAGTKCLVADTSEGPFVVSP